MSAAVIHTLIFDAIIKTSQRVFFLVEEMSINGDSLFNQFVNETDIYARLDVIEALMKDIYNHGSSISPILSKTVEISL